MKSTETQSPEYQMLMKLTAGTGDVEDIDLQVAEYSDDD